MSDFLQAASAILRAGWQCVASVEYPGTGIPIATILIGAVLVGIGFKVIQLVLGVTGISVLLSSVPKKHDDK